MSETTHVKVPLDPGPLAPRRLARAALACGLTFMLLNGLFVVLLALVLSIPTDEAIAERLREASSRGLLEEGTYSQYAHVGHGFDMFTECVGLGINLQNRDRSLFYRIAASPLVQPDVNGVPPKTIDQPCAVLRSALSQRTAKATMAYPRFWHGYQTYIRSALSVMSVGNMRRVTALVLFAALAFLCIRLQAWFGPCVWPVLLLPFALVGDLLTMPSITTHALPMAWTFASTAVLMVVLDRSPKGRSMLPVVLAFAAGAIYSFLSFLLNPSLAAGLIGFVVIAKGLANHSVNRHRDALIEGVLAMGAWFGGYALTWMAKWALAASALGVDRTLGDILLRWSGVEYPEAARAASTALLQTTYWVSGGFQHFRLMVAASAVATLALLGWGAWRRSLTGARLLDFCLLQIPALLQVAWIESLRAHSLEHQVYVSRNLFLFAICPVLAALWVSRREGREPIGRPHIASS